MQLLPLPRSTVAALISLHRHRPQFAGGVGGGGGLGLHLALEAFAQRQEGGGEDRVELFAGHLFDLGESDGGGHPFAVRPIRGHGVEGVGDGDDAGQRVDRLAAETSG